MSAKRYHMSAKRYHAFVSYSHAADGKLAPALQKALQKLAKPWYRRRSLEVFRDETGLSVDPHLWGAIVKGLDSSDWLLLLSSPDAAKTQQSDQSQGHGQDQPKSPVLGFSWRDGRRRRTGRRWARDG